MSINYTKVGRLIRHYRSQKKITQEELAFRIGSSAAYISCIESAKKKPSLQKITQISDALGITVNDLIYGPTTGNSAQLDMHELNRLISCCSIEKRKILLRSISMMLQTIITE